MYRPVPLPRHPNTTPPGCGRPHPSSSSVHVSPLPRAQTKLFAAAKFPENGDNTGVAAGWIVIRLHHFMPSSVPGFFWMYLCDVFPKVLLLCMSSGLPSTSFSLSIGVVFLSQHPPDLARRTSEASFSWRRPGVLETPGPCRGVGTLEAPRRSRYRKPTLSSSDIHTPLLPNCL